MTFEQMLKWKRGPLEEYEKLLKEQEHIFKKIRKINEDIEWIITALDCFTQLNDKDSERYKEFESKYNILVSKKLELSIKVKENNERLEREFY